MKLIAIVCLGLISSSAFAGRESHGLLPASFECGPQEGAESAYRSTLKVSDRIVNSGVLRIGGQAVPEMPCVDAWATRIPGEKLESTVFCAQPQGAEFLLELQESKTDSQLKIWKLESDHTAKLLEILPCL